MSLVRVANNRVLLTMKIRYVVSYKFAFIWRSFLKSTTSIFGALILGTPLIAHADFITDMTGYPSSLTVRNLNGNVTHSYNASTPYAMFEKNYISVQLQGYSVDGKLLEVIYRAPLDQNMCVSGRDNWGNAIMLPQSEIMAHLNNKLSVWWNGDQPPVAWREINLIRVYAWISQPVGNSQNRDDCILSVYVGAPYTSYPPEIVNPPIEKTSVCTLNDQNLNINLLSNQLRMDGVSSSGSLLVTCTAGPASDYTLRLTGTNVESGRLSFGNGVSANISLNGSGIQANGAGILLNSLQSGAISVNASLVGTASFPGLTNAYGILVLDAL